MFVVTESVAHHGNAEIGEYSYFEEAVEAAKNAGAKGVPKQKGRGEWCFSGGPESVGYWITEQ
jgi:hypothetical protein